MSAVIAPLVPHEGKEKTILSSVLGYANVWYFWQRYINATADNAVRQWLVDFNCEQNLFLSFLLGNPNMPADKKTSYMPRPQSLTDYDYSKTGGPT